MKKLLCAIVLCTLFNVGCSQNSNKETPHEHGPGSHEHEGEALQDEVKSENQEPEGQEAFTPAADSAGPKTHEKEHGHNEEAPHTH